MKATNPYWGELKLPGDSEDNIMGRSGHCMGMSKNLAVWRFGFAPESDMARITGIQLDDFSSVSSDGTGGGFLWVIATRKQGKIKELFRGFAVELPNNFRAIIDWEPTEYRRGDLV